MAQYSRSGRCQEQASEEPTVREADAGTRQLLCKALTVGGEPHIGGPTPDGEYEGVIPAVETRVKLCVC